jgi:hypothetical protein
MVLRWLAVILLSLLLFGVTGCQEALAWVGATVYQADTKAADSDSAAQMVREGLEAGPRIRVGYLSSPTLGTVFRGPQELGQHGYRPNWSEQNGIVYTCKAGHIDIGHVRKATDWTAFLAARTFRQIMNCEIESSFKLYEHSQYFVQLTYPDNWKDLSQEDKEQIAYDVSIRLGQYFAFVAATWHEIITWFGYKSKGFEPEFPSAFTWEETFSNLLGSHIALIALQDTQHTFNEAVTLALDRELQKLDAQPGHVSRRAAESVRGLWFSGALLWVNMKKRNLDIGLDDGFVTPWLVSSVCECEGAEPQPYPAPDLDFLSEYGFKVKFEIEPRIWEEGAILSVAYPDRNPRNKRIEPAIHYAPIMAHIRQEAVERYGPDVEQPN